MRWSTIVLFLLWGAINSRADQEIYSDALQNGWEDWSWAQTDSTVTPVHSGTSSLSVNTGAWEAAYFHNGSLNASLYTNLTFWINGGPTGGQKLSISGIASLASKSTVNLPDLLPDNWKQITVSLESIGVAGDPGFDGFWIQDRTGIPQLTFYIDDIRLVSGSGISDPATNAPVQVRVDAALNRHPISELIYGVAFASSNQLKDLNVPLNRSGGNSESRYNWQLNAHNRGFDWYFESLADPSALPGAETDDFIANSFTGSAAPMITVPMIGWVAKLGQNRGRLASYSVAKYGPQSDADWQWFADAGNGVRTGGALITTNDPNDANVLVNSSFQQNWIRHLTNRWNSSAQGGVQYYLMDNEPSLWHSTHRDVFPTGLRMSDLRDRFIDYAAKVRQVDPEALIGGPEEWGWSGYFYSGYDQQWGSSHGWSNLPDKATHNGADYLPWLLDQLRQHRDSTGESLLDIFTVHYYPQSGEYGDSSNVSSAMQKLRNRSTRSLWDTNYVDPSWIGDKVRLIPRLRQWVAQNYPGLKVGITEYSWGADEHINGATAQADILGIFGREGLDLATRWIVPNTGTPTYKAFQLYRNYDGSKSTFGNTSLSCVVPNPDDLSAFAAERSSDGALTVMVINKQAAATPLQLSVTNFPHSGLAQIWQLNSSNVIRQLPAIALVGEAFTNTLAGQSINLIVIPRKAELSLESIQLQNGSMKFEILGSIGTAFDLQASSDLKSWSKVRNITLQSSPQTVSETASSERTQFYRLVIP